MVRAKGAERIVFFSQGREGDIVGRALVPLIPFRWAHRAWVAPRFWTVERSGRSRLLGETVVGLTLSGMRGHARIEASRLKSDPPKEQAHEGEVGRRKEIIVGDGKDDRSHRDRNPRRHNLLEAKLDDPSKRGFLEESGENASK